MIEENKDLLKFNAEGVHPADMFLNARKVAIKAVDDFVAKHGEPMYCGFANVSINGGYRISYYDIMPKDHPYSHTQSMSIKEEACEAFRDELRKYGLTVYAESRAD